MRTSQFSARMNPAAYAAPFTAAMTGVPSSGAVVKASFAAGSPAVSGCSSTSCRSCPAENAWVPVPVITMHRTAGSSSAATSSLRRVGAMSPLNALRFASLSMLSSRTGP